MSFVSLFSCLVFAALGAESVGAEVVVSGYLQNNVAGEVQSGRIGLGASVGYYLRGRIGLELDGQLHGHFFRDEDVEDLAPPGVDLNTFAALASANVVVPYCVRGPRLGTWCPYATAGLGVIHAWFDGAPTMPDASGVSESQTDLAANGGVGVMHQLTRHIGFRVDARYFHAFVDEDATSGGVFEDYGFLRVSAGITLSLPSWW